LFAGLACAEPVAEADAKADPWYGYYGGWGGYPAWGYSGYSNWGYPGWGGYHLIGKRSADAEPTAAAEAKADPWYGYYGGYGYGYPAYGYGYSSWGYPAWGGYGLWGKK